MHDEFYKNLICVFFFAIFAFGVSLAGFTIIEAKKKKIKALEEQARQAELKEQAERQAEEAQMAKRQAIVDEVTAGLEISADQEEASTLRYFKSAKLLELVVNVKIKNGSEHAVMIDKMFWEIWISGLNIKTSIYNEPVIIEPHAEKRDVQLREVLLDSDVKKITWVEKEAKGYIEGLFHLQTEKMPVQKKFKIHGLVFRVPEETAAGMKTLIEDKVVDDLTGAFPRKFLDNNLQGFIDAANEIAPLTFMMVDLDSFKKVNDGYGHQVGDEALRRLSAALRKSIANQGYLVRYGGDEFSLILPNCPEDKAQAIADRIVQEAQGLILDTPQGQLKLTISVGVTTITERVFAQALIQCSDEMLGVSKREGKNKASFNRRKKLREF